MIDSSTVATNEICGLLWFGALRSVISVTRGLNRPVFSATRRLIRLGLLLKSDSERLQTPMTEAEFELADYNTKMQRPTIRPSPAQNLRFREIRGYGILLY